jgi:hypothetical protein
MEVVMDTQPYDDRHEPRGAPPEPVVWLPAWSERRHRLLAEAARGGFVLHQRWHAADTLVRTSDAGTPFRGEEADELWGLQQRGLFEFDRTQEWADLVLLPAGQRLLADWNAKHGDPA